MTQQSGQESECTSYVQTPAVESMDGIIWYNNMSRGGPPGVLMRLTRRHRAHGYYTCHRLGIWITQDASFLN